MAMDMNSDFEVEETASDRGFRWAGRIIAIIVILAVCAFGDVMYIKLMSDHFPPGFLLAVCYVGAFTSFLSVVYMLIGKHTLFTPGPQMTAAWFIFSVELALIALNLCLVFAGSDGNGILAAWDAFAPATPVFNMAGVAILFFMDEHQKMKHEDVEMSWDMRRAQRKHLKAMAKARLRLQGQHLNFLVTELNKAATSPESLNTIRNSAIDLNAHLLGQLTGGRTYTALPAGSYNPPEDKTVDSQPPRRDRKPDIEQPRESRVVKSLPKENPVKSFFKGFIKSEEAAPVYDTAQSRTPRQRPVTSAKQAPVSAVAQKRQQARQQRLRSAKAAFIEEVEAPNPPLSQRQNQNQTSEGVQVKKNRGEYIVNRNAAKIHLND